MEVEGGENGRKGSLRGNLMAEGRVQREDRHDLQTARSRSMPIFSSRRSAIDTITSEGRSDHLEGSSPVKVAMFRA